jgi:hypothetical protein
MTDYFLGGIWAVLYTAAFVPAGGLLIVIADGLVVDANTASPGQLLRQSLGYSPLVGLIVSVLVTAFSGGVFSLLDNLIYSVAVTVPAGADSTRNVRRRALTLPPLTTARGRAGPPAATVDGHANIHRLRFS